MPSRRALIVGAGPGGLSAACGLRLAGFDVDMVERTADRTVLGSELHIMTASLRALDALGAADYVAAAGVPIEGPAILALDGTELARVKLDSVTRDDLPPSVGLTRSALHGAIYQRASELGARIEHDMSVDAIEDGEEGAIVTLTDGQSKRYDLVVGADGIASKVRTLCFPEAAPPAYAGQCVWRASVPRRTDTCLYTAVGGRNVPGLITVSPEESYVFCLVPYETPPRPDPADYAAMVREALAEFGGVFAEAREDIDGSRTLHFAPLQTTLQPLPWHNGRIVMIGDAVHGTTPHLGYGAGLAIEDGMVLGEECARGESIAEALAAFGQRRYARCAEVVQTGLRISRWQQAPGPGFDQGFETNRVWQMLLEPV